MPAVGEILVKVHFVALNPADPNMIQHRLTPTGSIIGLDYAGEVVLVGPEVDGWNPGDRIAGITPGGVGGPWGAAAEYAAVDAALAWHVPESIDLASATTFGIGGATAALALYYHLQVPMPPAQVPDAPWFFVAGGSSSVGFFLMQWVKRAGFKVVATASEHNFDIVKQYGADKVFSYHDAPAAVAAIRALQPPPTVGADMIGGSCGDLAAEVLAGGRYLSIQWQCHKDAEIVRLGAAFMPVSAYWSGSVAYPSTRKRHSGISPSPLCATGLGRSLRVFQLSFMTTTFAQGPSLSAGASRASLMVLMSSTEVCRRQSSSMRFFTIKRFSGCSFDTLDSKSRHVCM